MPEYSGTIQAQLAIIENLPPSLRKMAEVVAVYWPAPTGTIVYASAAYDELPNREGLAPALEDALGYTDPILVTLKPSNRAPLLALPRTASVGDDKIGLTFSDLDGEFSALLMTHGEGIRCEVFNFWNAQPEGDDPFDLLLSAWRGHLHTPSEYNRPEVRVSASVGFRSAQLQIPRQPNAVFCPFIFGAHLQSQAEIDYHQGCPYNVHTGGDVGVPGFTDCPRTSRAVCVERLETENYWPGVNIRPDPIPNNQTVGPNLLAYAHGNQSALGQPIRVVIGYRHVKALLLLAFRPEYNNNHPDDAFAAALFEVCKGPIQSLAGFRINDQLVGAEHLQQRLGALGQTPTDWSPDVEAFSGTAISWGRIQTNVLDMRVEDVTGSVYAHGLNNIRIYTDETSFTPAWSKNRMWGLLETYCNPQWGYGVDYPRVLIESAIDVAEWCDEVVAMQDANGNTFGGVRSTFNVDLNARPTQQQIKDTCTAGRIGLPFEWNGKDVFVPLRTESLVGVPEFTDEGSNRNIVYDGANSTLQWSQVSDAELTNQWTANFDDETGGQFVDTQLIFGDQLQQLRAGRAWGDRSRRVINKSQAAFGITNFLETARLGNTLLYLGPLDSGGIANNCKIKFTTWYSRCFNVQPYKLIRVLNTKLQDHLALYSEARFADRPETYPWYQGVTYSYFRVMKFERKGDLKVEIEAQLYPQDYYASLDGPAELPACDPDELQPLATDVTWVDTSGVEVLETNALECTSLISGTALSQEIFQGTKCAAVTFTLQSAEQEGTWSVTIEDTTGDNRYGWRFNMFGPSLTYRPVVDGVIDPENVFGSHGDVNWAEVGGEYTHRIFYDGAGTVELQFSFSGSPGTFATIFSYSGLPTDRNYRVRADIFTLGKEVPPVLFKTSGLLIPPPLATEPGDPELALGQEVVAGLLGPEVRIHGTITFPSFHLPLRADVYVTPPGGVETLIEDNIAPLTGSVTAQFTYTPTAGAGEYCFRVVVETAEETPIVGGEVTECITITNPAQLFDRDNEPILDRDLNPIFDR